MKTIEEVIRITGLSRRQIQEFQRYGLADRPNSKNKYGHLEYSDIDIERLWELRFYKELGYDAPKITKLECELYTDREQRLTMLISELEERQKKIGQLINIAKTMKSAGVTVSAISKIYAPISEMRFNDFLTIAAETFVPDAEIDYSLIERELFNETTEKQLLQAVEMIQEGLFGGDTPDKQMAHSGLEILYDVWVIVFPDSIDMFRTMLHMFAENYELKREIVDEFGAGSIEQLLSALDAFCEDHGISDLDKEYEKALNTLPTLRIAGRSPDSTDTQDAISVLFSLYDEIKYVSLDSALKTLERLGEAYVISSEEKNEIFPIGRDDAIYIREAIRYFVNKKREDHTWKV